MRRSLIKLAKVLGVIVRAVRLAQRMHEEKIKRAAQTLYTWRLERRTHPEGETDKAGRWWPSARENLDGVTSRIRTPSRAYPWAYMIACRAHRHCTELVRAALSGVSVPPDVRGALRRSALCGHAECLADPERLGAACWDYQEGR